MVAFFSPFRGPAVVAHPVRMLLAGLALLLAPAGASRAQPPAFAPPATYTKGMGTTFFTPNLDGLAVADVNADGKPDLLTVSDNRAGVLLGNGNGTFQTVVYYTTGLGQTTNIAVADMNADGQPDLVVCGFPIGSSASFVGTLLGNGNGTFQPIGATTRVAVGVATGIAVADLDADGKLDVLVNGFSGGAQLFTGKGDGTFNSRAGAYSIGFALNIVLADVNGDAKPDLLGAAIPPTNGTNSNTNTVGVLLGIGSTAPFFQTGVRYSTGSNSSPYGLAVADVNGDGKPDLLTANNGTNTAGVLLGNGDGTFQAITTYSTGSGSAPTSIAVADVNGDGRRDLLTANSGTSTAGVLLGNGDGTFQAVSTFPTSTMPYTLAVADVNADGKPDLLLNSPSTGTAVVLRNTTGVPLPVELSAFTATPTGPAAVRLAWATASEKNSARFEVERSADGREFARIGTVAAASSSSAPRAYELLDANPPPPQSTLYYRLRQVDADGSFSYSPVRTVQLTNSPAHHLTIFPNPAAGAATLTGALPGAVATVYDALGRPVATATADASGTAALVLPAGLPAGVYVVRAGPRAVRLVVE